ncbi:hypothetical protein AQUCO_12000023v1 [Aquilegia coerulea]|uniref:J domain-containing protein n=1 Tax=Aquilegia coerulea TaxID=218851 RepID=A0A2G5C1X2_AQUCA|nr:hypothetical protein AQUCO_12000023v1 [Aquilegia coerulea]
MVSKAAKEEETSSSESSSSEWPNKPLYNKEEEVEGMRVWGILLFGLIGATATTLAVGQLRSTVNWFYTQERIRRMQSVFHRERNKYKRSYQSWRENDQEGYHPQFQRNDWYWKTDTSYKDQRANSGATPRHSGTYMLSHHYSVLGLDRWRTKPYTEDEIKSAFRTKAKEFHPDQNQDNKEAAEAKFKDVMTSYEAIKLERKNGKS